MKLKHECIRDVLLTAEEEIELGKMLENESILESPRLKDYAEEDIVYTIQKLKEADFLEAAVAIYPDGNQIRIKSLSYEGHLFLDTIRDEKVWKEVKKMASKFGSSVSIKILSDLGNAYFKNLFPL